MTRAPLGRPDPTPPAACDACLRRAMLLGRLAAFIEKVVTGEPGSRVRELLALSDSDLVRAVGGRHAGRLLAESRTDEPDGLRAELRAARCWAACRHGHGSPAALLDLGAEAPAAVLGRGDPATLDAADPGVTIVGSRRASGYGKQVARELGRLLAAAGVPVISGLALGIDACAHQGAVDGGGVTLAVLGSGPDRPYPATNRRLYSRIVSERGAVVSELPPGAGAFRWTFPARNRIMAALGRITVVVEAAAHSGSLITVGFAHDMERTVGAVPGPVNSWRSEGTNALIADGAQVISGAQDVLDLMFGPGARDARPPGPSLDGPLAAVLDQVESGCRTPDDVAAALGGDAGAAAVGLARLELLGYVTADVTGTYSRTQLGSPESL